MVLKELTHIIRAITDKHMLCGMSVSLVRTNAPPLQLMFTQFDSKSNLKVQPIFENFGDREIASFTYKRSNENAVMIKALIYSGGVNNETSISSTVPEYCTASS